MENEKKDADTAGDEVSCCLEEMECAMAEWQCALLKRHLAELEKCTARQRELCRELGELVLEPAELDPVRVTPGAGGTAERVREQGRRFAAILRRMRKNLQTLQRALQGPAEVYRPPEPVRVHTEF